jgi:FkbM family methyltransferase
LTNEASKGDPVLTQAGIVVTTSIEGREVRFFVANRNDSIQSHHLKGEFYEKEELAIMRKHWRGDRAYLDIGANVGNHACYVSLYLDTTKIIVFEPNPPALEVLRLNLTLNKCANVDTRFLGVAVGATTGRVKLVPDPKHPNNLGGTSAETDVSGDTPLVPADDLLSVESIGFIKIDVEGMEMEVLSGLERTIRRWRPNLFIEVRDRNADAFAEWAKSHQYQVVEKFARYLNICNYMTVPVESVAAPVVPSASAPMAPPSK